MCVYACVVYMCIWYDLRMHRSEVNVRSPPQLLSILIFFSETGTLIELGIHQFGKAGWPVSSQYPPEITNVLCHP